MKNWIVKSIRAVVFADRDAFLWIQHKLGFSGYQMAALAWLKESFLAYFLAGGFSNAINAASYRPSP